VNGAKLLMNTLVENGVEVCFGNPGTSEMHLVDAISKTEKMRAVLCLFEGVVTGAADGYARMAGKPAATLLHLGPGLGNALANIHNARRARSPMLNIIGQHAIDHLQYDAPLTSDIVGIATPVCHHVHSVSDINQLSEDTARSIAETARGVGQIAALIIPADMAWSAPASQATSRCTAPEPDPVTSETLELCASALQSGKRSALLLDDSALYGEGLLMAGRIAQATGAKLLAPTFYSRMERGAGRVPVDRIPYFAEMATEFLQEFEQIILVGCGAPVAFFAYPGKRSWLAPEECEILPLSKPNQDSTAALTALATNLGIAKGKYLTQEPASAELQTGALTPLAVAGSLLELMPENSIVVDEGATSSFPAYTLTQGAAAHDWLTLTGGSIGQGLPAAVGAAIACPQRKVIALEGDGSAMYTVQALWSMARENLDVIVVMYVNNSYKILNIEMLRVGVEEPSPRASEMLELDKPFLDWIAIARGMGLKPTAAATAQEFHQQLSEAVNGKGPHFIAAMLSD
jgi:acetolactate synthase I/II/III large subunit